MAMTTTTTHLDRIAVNPGVVHGKPRIGGTWVTVRVILELLAADETLVEVFAVYDDSPCRTS